LGATYYVFRSRRARPTLSSPKLLLEGTHSGLLSPLLLTFPSRRFHFPLLGPSPVPQSAVPIPHPELSFAGSSARSSLAGGCYRWSVPVFVKVIVLFCVVLCTIVILADSLLVSSVFACISHGFTGIDRSYWSSRMRGSAALLAVPNYAIAILPDRAGAASESVLTFTGCGISAMKVWW